MDLEVMRLNTLAVLLLLASSTAFGDHSCLEERANGSIVKRESRLPQGWFKVGDASVVDPTLHLSLKKRYGSKYISGVEEGEYGYLCLKDKTGYVSVSTSGFGTGVEYSSAKPDCLKCKQAKDFGERFTSGTGLRLGQTKARASSMLGTPITQEIVSVIFEEQTATGELYALHTEILRVEFKDDLLVRSSVYDYQESA
jgi:hypothetical protein